MATLGLAPIQVLTTKFGSVDIRHRQQAASQTFKAGALLVNSSGRVAECGADPTNLLGVGLMDAPNVTNANVMFAQLNSVDEVEVTLTTSAFTYALVGTEIDNRYGAAKDATTGYWYADQGETTADVFVITGFVSKIGDINPRVRAKIIQSLINAA